MPLYHGSGNGRSWVGTGAKATGRHCEEMILFRCCIVLLTAVLVTPAASAGQQACVDRDLLYRLDGNDLVWSDVRAVSTDDSRLVVLTGSYPAIHLFELVDGTHRQSWGGSGEGPGEFRGRTGVALVGSRVYAHDGTQGRLSIFEVTGDLVRTVRLRDLGMPDYVSIRLDRAGGETLLFEWSVPMGNERSVFARSFGASANEDAVRQDTVIVYPRTTATELRLTSPGGPPRLRLPPPYWPAPQWTPVSGGVAFWQEPDSEVKILGFDGALKPVVALALDDRFEVTAEDREFWFQNAIPQEIFGQRGVFGPLREEARRTVDFPRYHPLMFELLGGPDDLLWVRRTPDGRDQVWDIVGTQGQLASRVSLTPGQALMAVIPDHLVLRVTDDLGVESVEVHRCRSLPMPEVVAIPSAAQESRNWALSGDSRGRQLVRDDEGLCTTCARLEELAVLGDMAGDGFIQWSRVVTRDSLGRYWVGQGESLKVYDSAGRFLREVGRAGEGPAEFGRIAFAHAGSDGFVHVLDPRNTRESVFDATFALLEEQRLPGPSASLTSAAALNGDYVVNAWVTTAEMIGLPLHIIRGEEVVRSFGMSDATGPHDAMRSIRILAARSDGVIAAARRFAYTVEMWDSSGSRLVEFHHEVSLNEVEVKQVPYNLTDNPRPHEVIAVRFDDADRLWVLFRMMRDGWERHYEPREFPGGLVGIRQLPNSTLDSIHESRLDIIDLQSGTVVVRAQLPGLFETFAGDGLLLEHRELPNAEIQLAVWRVTIDGR